MSWQLAPLTAKHLEGLLAVQQACYGAHYMEAKSVFEQRLRHPRQCSLVLLQGAQVCAYAVACRAQQGEITPFHGNFASQGAADTLYLHDLAVWPSHTGQGLAAALLQSLLQQARVYGLAYAALVAVSGAQTFWQRHGFAACPLGQPLQQQRLLRYGPEAVYMRRDIHDAS